jgi:hypothetical protein
MLSRRIAGDMMAICTVWLCWVLLAPIVADRGRAEPAQQHICPMLLVTHGIGPDLKTYTEARDLCSQ